MVFMTLALALPHTSLQNQFVLNLLNITQTLQTSSQISSKRTQLHQHTRRSSFMGCKMQLTTLEKYGQIYMLSKTIGILNHVKAIEFSSKFLAAGLVHNISGNDMLEKFQFTRNFDFLPSMCSGLNVDNASNLLCDNLGVQVHGSVCGSPSG